MSNFAICRRCRSECRKCSGEDYLTDVLLERKLIKQQSVINSYDKLVDNILWLAFWSSVFFFCLGMLIGQAL